MTEVPKFSELTEWTPPDHPWDEARQVAGYCEVCGGQQILHDGNLDRAFDVLAALDGGDTPTRRKPMTDVFVTSHGRQYHDPVKHYMTGSAKVVVEEGEARAHGYQPCSYCFGGVGRLPAVRRDPSRAFMAIDRKNTE